MIEEPKVKETHVEKNEVKIEGQASKKGDEV